MKTTKANFHEVKTLAEFDKDLKKLKRFRTLPDDLDVFIKTQLDLFHKQKIDNQGTVRIADLGIEYPLIFKARKFACRALKGKGVNSGIRVIYAYYEDKDTIELIEVYYKGDKENEDRDRIKAYYS
ncbi:MAG: hypothetical protein ISS45_05795 [Candidatus Omnitrophica bacterium]|nr:hypothetical protein [Candidatus Omnitrophota bacterium]